ncbi:MAG: hypothetical protein WC705_00675 [Candidatus Paceibacterota bacterium]|jgi:hypothetical protein
MSQEYHIKKDFAIIAFSIFLAFLLAQTGVLEVFFNALGSVKFLGSFLVGMFFVSIFTVAPASVVLAEIAKTAPSWEIAIFAGLGGMVGDFIIFKFIRDSFFEDIKYLLGQKGRERISLIFRSKWIRWLTPLLGILVIASPIPDEIGLTLMGFSKMKTAPFLLLSLVLNSIGILVIVSILKGIL